MMNAILMAPPLSLWEYRGMDLSGAAFYKRLMEAFTDLGEEPTQTQLAEWAGLQQPAVSKWKSDASFPDYENARRLALRARVSIAWLWLGLGNKNNGGDMDDQTNELLEAWHRMPEQARREMLEYIRYRAQAERPTDSAPSSDKTPH
jgi:transcriptional regulator with XRE-family HTH domain